MTCKDETSAPGLGAQLATPPSVLRPVNNLRASSSGAFTPRLGKATPATGKAGSVSTPRSRPRTPVGSSNLRASISLDCPGSSGLQFELNNLRNELRSKQREHSETEEEVRTLKAAVVTKDKALAKGAAEAACQQERAVKAEQALAAATKQLRVSEEARAKASSSAEAASRQADKLTQKLANIPKDDKFSAQVASLEAEVKSLKAEGANLAKDNKACYTQIRAKDKQLDAAAKEVDHARQTELHNKELQNSILDLNRQLEEAKERESTLLAVERQHKADAASLTSQMNAAEQRAADTEHRLALTSTELKTAQERCAELETEAVVLSDELTRTSAVAARAAGREVLNGSKDEGVVPVTLHIEEVRYLQGEGERLREKIRHLERNLQASHQVQEHLQRQLSSQKRTTAASVNNPYSSNASSLQESMQQNC